MNGIEVRPETPADHVAIRRVVRDAFPGPEEAQLVDALRASEVYRPELALVATVDGEVVGHVMVTRAALVDGERRRTVALLAPLAVAPDHQRRGVGAALLAEVARRAAASGEPAIVLEGDPGYYGRHGYEPAARYGIEMPLPSWAPLEAAQVRWLGDPDPSLRGRVVYPPPFDDLPES
ncbi:MAG TPA: N-acetyltransferase [Acidimicrobiales bacterium]|nr:N-acetyltransferase [Acidimicrobiales bacterium]